MEPIKFELSRRNNKWNLNVISGADELVLFHMGDEELRKANLLSAPGMLIKGAILITESLISEQGKTAPKTKKRVRFYHPNGSGEPQEGTVINEQADEKSRYYKVAPDYNLQLTLKWNKFYCETIN